MKPGLNNGHFQNALRQIHEILKTLCNLSSNAKNGNDAIQALLVIKNEILRINEILDRHDFRRPRISLPRWLEGVKLEESGGEVKVDDNTKNWQHLALEPASENNQLVPLSSRQISLPTRPNSLLSHALDSEVDAVKDEVFAGNAIKREVDNDVYGVDDDEPVLTSGVDSENKIGDDDTPPWSPGSEEHVPSFVETTAASPIEDVVGNPMASGKELERELVSDGGYFEDGQCKICKVVIWKKTEESVKKSEGES